MMRMVGWWKFGQIHRLCWNQGLESCWTVVMDSSRENQDPGWVQWGTGKNEEGQRSDHRHSLSRRTYSYCNLQCSSNNNAGCWSGCDWGPLSGLTHHSSDKRSYTTFYTKDGSWRTKPSAHHSLGGGMERNQGEGQSRTNSTACHVEPRFTCHHAHSLHSLGNWQAGKLAQRWYELGRSKHVWTEGIRCHLHVSCTFGSTITPVSNHTFSSK